MYVLNKGKAVSFSLISSLERAPAIGDKFNNVVLIQDTDSSLN